MAIFDFTTAGAKYKCLIVCTVNTKRICDMIYYFIVLFEHLYLLKIILYCYLFFFKDTSISFPHILVGHIWRLPGVEVIKLFSCLTQLSIKFQLLINTKMLKNKDFSCFQTLRWFGSESPCPAQPRVLTYIF